MKEETDLQATVAMSQTGKWNTLMSSKKQRETMKSPPRSNQIKIKTQKC